LLVAVAVHHHLQVDKEPLVQVVELLVHQAQHQPMQHQIQVQEQVA
jgi:hypothetical protein